MTASIGYKESIHDYVIGRLDDWADDDCEVGRLDE